MDTCSVRGDTVSQTNVLSFARINVMYLPELGGQLTPRPVRLCAQEINTDVTTHTVKYKYASQQRTIPEESKVRSTSVTRYRSTVMIDHCVQAAGDRTQWGIELPSSWRHLSGLWESKSLCSPMSGACCHLSRLREAKTQCRQVPSAWCHLSGLREGKSLCGDVQKQASALHG